jgi:pimeloyl-ACP methyl ester carboxylesterase
MVRHSVDVPSGRISYLEQGKGPVALFVHGVLLNGYLWRHQLADLSDVRRCIAVDLLAHGDAEIAPDQDVSVKRRCSRNSSMPSRSSKWIWWATTAVAASAQIFAALYPERVRGLTLTDGDTHDNWPPEAFKPFLAMAAAGGLPGTLEGHDRGQECVPGTAGPGAGIRASGTGQ